MIFATSRAESEWSQFKEYLSPAFFDVVSPLQAGSQIAKLAKSLMSQQESVAALRDKLSAGLRLQGIAASVGPAPSHDGTEPAPPYHAVLEVYFYQLLHMPAALLDFRRSTVSFGDRVAYWDPSSLHAVWDQEFIAALREMYAGFYDDENARFLNATQKLGLSAASGILLDHFGKDQSNHRFSLKDFRKTFHDVFVAAKNARSQIHPQFLPFGLGLATLYQLLESTGQAFDVRAAFYKARG